MLKIGGKMGSLRVLESAEVSEKFITSSRSVSEYWFELAELESDWSLSQHVQLDCDAVYSEVRRLRAQAE